MVINEGSGLDPANRVTACGLARFLARAVQAGSILPGLLQHYGQTAAKTGTFEAFGVRTLAGYLLQPNGAPGAAFALMCNGESCTSATHERYKQEADGWARFLYAAPLPVCGTIGPEW